jgi:hypothetical protein
LPLLSKKDGGSVSEYKELVTRSVTKAVVESCYMALTDCGCPDNRDVFVKVVRKQLGISSEEAENYFDEIKSGLKAGYTDG